MEKIEEIEEMEQIEENDIVAFSNIETLFDEENEITNLNIPIVICGGLFVEKCTQVEIPNIYFSIKKLVSMIENKNIWIKILASGRDIYILCKILQFCYKLKELKVKYKHIIHIIEKNKSINIEYDDTIDDIDELEDLENIPSNKRLKTLKKFLDSYSKIYDLNSEKKNDKLNLKEYFISFLEILVFNNFYESENSKFFPKILFKPDHSIRYIFSLFVKKREYIEKLLCNICVSYETNNYIFKTDSDFTFSNERMTTSINNFLSTRIISEDLLLYINSFRRKESVGKSEIVGSDDYLVEKINSSIFEVRTKSTNDDISYDTKGSYATKGSYDSYNSEESTESTQNKKIHIIGDSTSICCCPFLTKIKDEDVILLNCSLGREHDKVYTQDILLKSETAYTINSSYIDDCFGYIILEKTGKITCSGKLPFDSTYINATLEYKILKHENDPIRISPDEFFNPSDNYIKLFNINDTKLKLWICKDKYLDKYLIVLTSKNKIKPIEDLYIVEKQCEEDFICSPKTAKTAISNKSINDCNDYTLNIQGDDKFLDLQDDVSITRSVLLDEESVSSRLTTKTQLETKINDFLETGNLF